jgi:hypothetical protein
MAGKEELHFSPAELKVNDALPAYPITNMLQISKAKPTDKEVAEGKPLRIAAREKVVKEYDKIITREREFKKRMGTATKKYWETVDAKTKKMFGGEIDFLNKNPAYLDLLNYLKQELVWWNNNIELSPREVTTRDLQFDETIKKKMEATEKAYTNQGDTTKQQAKVAEEKQKAANDAIRNRTLWDDIVDACSIMAASAFFILYILVGIRCGSFAANDLLYKPVPYRIIAFIYTFIFCPVFAPYYLWKVIKHYVWGTPLPLFEGLLPLNAYDPSEPLTISKRLFGYADTPLLKEWIKVHQDEETKARDAAVISKGIKQKIIQEHG